MIIQCGRCSAKFRFDDALMRDEGVWVRCGLCAHEFFKPHPLASPSAVPSEGGDADPGEIPFEGGADMPDGPTGKLAEQDIGVDSVGRGENGTSTEKLLKVISEKKRDDKPERPLPQPKKSAPGKSRVAGLARMLTALIFTLAVAAGVGYYSFPDIGRQIVGDLSAHLPWLEKQQPSQPPVTERMKIEDVSQRFIVNLIAGPVRVVEGTAVNQSGHPVTRLQVKITLEDQQGKKLGEKQVFAGNMLSDNDLMILPEAEISARLANPAGSTASNDRIAPGGRIPFMIVWISEPPGGFKTAVTVAGAERLLK
jgi:predicted Zn finger-like uncharacterized protein